MLDKDTLPIVRTYAITPNGGSKVSMRFSSNAMKVLGNIKEVCFDTETMELWQPTIDSNKTYVITKHGNGGQLSFMAGSGITADDLHKVEFILHHEKGSDVYELIPLLEYENNYKNESN